MTVSLSGLPPGSILLLGALLVPLLRGRLQQAYLLALPAVSYQLPVASCQLRIVRGQWSVAGCQPIAVEHLLFSGCDHNA